MLPSDGSGVGRTVAATLGAALAPLGAALVGSEAAGVAAAEGWRVDDGGLDAEPAQAATSMVVRSAAQMAGIAFCGRSIGRCYPRLTLRRLEDPEIAR